MQKRTALAKEEPTPAQRISSAAHSAGVGDSVDLEAKVAMLDDKLDSVLALLGTMIGNQKLLISQHPNEPK